MSNQTQPIDLIDIESRPVKLLIDGLRSGLIKIDNSFQRRYVWTEPDKASLIETILIGYPIPEVYLWQNETDPESGETLFSIVDGQQRLGAVLSFINDEFKLLKSGITEKEAPYAGKRFSELSPELKGLIWKYKFSVRFLKEAISKESIIKLFLRLNSTNTTLNPQELRNASFNGEFIKLAEKISKLEFWSKHEIFSYAEVRRMLDIQFISTILIFIRSGIEEETTQSAINKMYDTYNETYSEAEQDFTIIQECLTVLDQLISGQHNLQSIVKKKTHFYTIFILGYYIRTKKLQPTNYAALLDKWYENYINNTLFDNPSLNALLEEYQQLSQEGVQKQKNRQRRFEILQTYIMF